MKVEKRFKEKLLNNAVEIPPHTLVQAITYLLYGTPPGHFFELMLLRQVYSACFCADVANKQGMADIMKMIDWNFPDESRGTKEKIWSWIKLSNDERREILERKGYLSNIMEILRSKNPDELYTEINIS